MKEKTKSLLESLIDISTEKEMALVIESRGTHIISSAISLIESIQEQFGDELADELERRLLSSIRIKNDNKFKKGAKKLK
jgi:hypothetical protein